MATITIGVGIGLIQTLGIYGHTLGIFWDIAATGLNIYKASHKELKDMKEVSENNRRNVHMKQAYGDKSI